MPPHMETVTAPVKQKAALTDSLPCITHTIIFRFLCRNACWSGQYDLLYQQVSACRYRTDDTQNKFQRWYSQLLSEFQSHCRKRMWFLSFCIQDGYLFSFFPHCTCPVTRRLLKTIPQYAILVISSKSIYNSAHCVNMISINAREINFWQKSWFWITFSPKNWKVFGCKSRLEVGLNFFLEKILRFAPRILVFSLCHSAKKFKMTSAGFSAYDLSISFAFFLQ